MGIGPTHSAWEAERLPLHHGCVAVAQLSYAVPPQIELTSLWDFPTCNFGTSPNYFFEEVLLPLVALAALGFFADFFGAFLDLAIIFSFRNRDTKLCLQCMLVTTKIFLCFPPCLFYVIHRASTSMCLALVLFHEPQTSHQT